MAEALRRVEDKIDSVDSKVDRIEATSATKTDLNVVNAKVETVERDLHTLAVDMATVKALTMQPKTPWTSTVGVILGVVAGLVSLATLLIVILDH